MIDARIPITVGVIGNRDAIITNAHRDRIKKIFNDIENKYPNNPVTLYSQLAIGADTEVARIFIELKEKSNRQYNLIVPLPYDIEDYKQKQFESENDLKTFNTILSKAEKYFVVENDYTTITGDSLLYRNSGKFVADSSLILISLWDEKVYNDKENYIGGTAEIVKYKIQGIFNDELNNQIFDLDGNLISIYCERNDNKEGVKYKFKKKCEDLSCLLRDISIDKALNKITLFNKDLKSKNIVPNPIERLKQIRRVISTETSKQQKIYNDFIVLFFIISFVFFVLFEAYKHLNLLVWIFVPLFLVVVYGFIERIKFKKSNNHHEYIENRVLSEALRIQIFWNLADLNKNVSNYILRIHKLEYNWVKHFLHTIYGLTYDTTKTKQEKITIIQKDWITNQKDWFTEHLEDIKTKEKKLNNYSNRFLIAGLVSLLALFTLKLIIPEIFSIKPTEFPLSKEYLHIKHIEHYTHYFIILVSILFGLSAVLKTYLDKKGYSQIKKQYIMSKNVFETADDKLNQILKDSHLDINNKETDLDRILFLAGKEALIETGNWYLIMKEKEAEFDLP